MEDIKLQTYSKNERTEQTVWSIDVYELIQGSVLRSKTKKQSKSSGPFLKKSQMRHRITKSVIGQITIPNKSTTKLFNFVQRPRYVIFLRHIVCSLNNTRLKVALKFRIINTVLRNRRSSNSRSRNKPGSWTAYRPIGARAYT